MFKICKIFVQAISWKTHAALTLFIFCISKQVSKYPAKINKQINELQYFSLNILILNTALLLKEVAKIKEAM